MLKDFIRRIASARIYAERGVERKELEGGVCPEMPLPPPELRERVGAVPDAETFLVVGQRIYGNITDMLLESGIRIGGCRSILDFGCGCGRLLRYFRPNGGFIAGCDIDKEAAGWCAENLHNVNQLVVNGPWPPLPFEDGTFDLICAISVFTHLPQEMESAWLTELARLLRPEGILIASVMGQTALASEVTDAVLREEFQKNGMCRAVVYPPGGVFPDFYQVTYHARDYVEASWGRHYRIAGYYERAVNFHQDAVVCRKL